MTSKTSVPETPRQGSPVMFIVLVLMALIGVGITDYSPADAHLY